MQHADLGVFSSFESATKSFPVGKSTLAQQLLPGEKIISMVATMNTAAKAMTPAMAG